METADQTYKVELPHNHSIIHNKNDSSRIQTEQKLENCITAKRHSQIRYFIENELISWDFI